jgi:hypothetical protein
MVTHVPENLVLLEPASFGVGGQKMVTVNHNVLISLSWLVISPLLEALVELDPHNIQMVEATALPGKHITQKEKKDTHENDVWLQYVAQSAHDCPHATSTKVWILEFSIYKYPQCTVEQICELETVLRMFL